MIVVRDIFRIKFGQTKEAVALWKQAGSVNKKLGYGQSMRMLTDFVGPSYYTLVLESSFESMAAFEKAIGEVTASPEWRAIYQKIVPLTESGHREILKEIA